MASSPPTSPIEKRDGVGIDISGQAHVRIEGDLVAGAKIVGYTAEQVSILLAQISKTYQVKPFDGRSPYVGLAAFQEQDADRFFGRETLVQNLVARVSSARFVVIAGPSGSGKSSLVRAGLIPALKKGQVPGSDRWLYETLKPGRAPLDELARVASAFTGSLDAGDDLRAQGLKDPSRLHRWADLALKDDPARRAVIFVDQFEEIFTQIPREREAERAAFLNLLTSAATVENGRVLVLFALRSDFVSNCASYPALNALVNQQFLQVGAMSPDELVSAIARPALQVGLRLDPALIAQIVNDVRGEPGALPLMQFALQDLFEAEKSKGELTLDGYLARGGLRKALERHADAEFAKLDDTEKELARRVFGGLVEIGRGSQDTRRTALFNELVPAGADAGRVHALVTELADARLLTTDQQGGVETVTLAHEKLIDAWDWLHRLVSENREVIALQNEIAGDAQEWSKHQGDESYLYRGARLATAREKLEQRKLVLGGVAQAFVEASIAAHERERREQQRRTRAVIGALAAASTIFAALAILAFVLQQRATNAQQNEIAARQTAQAEATRALLGEQKAADAASTAEAERADAEQAKADALSAADAADTAAREAGRQKILADTAKATAVAAANEARARLLVAQAQQVFEEDPLLGVRLGLEGLALASQGTSQTQTDLADAVARLMKQGRVLKFGSDLEQLYPSPDSKRFVSARGAAPNELRGMDGSLLTTFRGQIEKVEYSPDPRATYFTVRFSSLQSELRRSADGHLLGEFTQPVRELKFSRDPDTTYLLVQYIIGAELRLTRDGSLAPFAGQVFDAFFSGDPNGSYFIVRYTDKSSELRRTGDGSLLASLTGIPLAAHFSDQNPQATAAYVKIDYVDQPSELRRTMDGKVIPLPKNVTGFDFSPDPAATYLIANFADQPTALLRTRDGSLVPLSGQFSGATFSPDPAATYFVVRYQNETVELRRTADAALVPLAGQVTSITFSPDPAASYFVVHFQDGPTELRRTADATLVPLAGQVTSITFSPDPTLKYFVVDYQDKPRELRRTSDGALITTLLVSGAPLQFSRDPGATFFVVDYVDGRTELRRSSNGSVFPLGNQIQFIDFDPDPTGTYFVVGYREATIELRRSADGAKVANLASAVSAIGVSPYAAQTYFVVRFDDGHAEIWAAGANPRQLANLGQGLGQLFFDREAARVVVWYTERYAYLLDLDFLNTLVGMSSPLTPQELISLGCRNPYPSQPLDESKLKPYLDGQPAQACRSN